MTSAPRPGKLRTQVLIGVLMITIGTLAVFDVAAVTALHTYLVKQTDGTLQSALTSTRPQLPELLPASRKAGQAANSVWAWSCGRACGPSRRWPARPTGSRPAT
jgi:hypothetical protein